MRDVLPAENLSRRIAVAARSLQAEIGSADTMDLAARLAVEVVGAAEEAGITLVSRRRSVETSAYTSKRGLRVDQLQYELGVGPCLAAIWDEEVVSVPDLASDDRWGRFGPRAAEETGVRSMLCVRMFTHRQRMGALNLYSSRVGAFDEADQEAGVSFAAHAAIAVFAAQNDDSKEVALDSRSLIGQATGIAMERFDLDAVRAFAVLKRISQDSNVKLHEVAAELVRTRHLPAAE